MTLWGCVLAVCTHSVLSRVSKVVIIATQRVSINESKGRLLID